MPKTLTELMDKHRKLVVSYDTSNVEDEVYYHDAWDELNEAVTSIMKKMRTTYFFAYGLSLTWRNVSGYISFTTNNSELLIYKLAPDTDFTMKIYTTADKNIYEVVMFHHDKPMGESVYLMSQSMAKKKRVMETYFN